MRIGLSKMPITNQPLDSAQAKEFNFLWAVVAMSVMAILLLFGYSYLVLTPSSTDLVAENTEEAAILVGMHIKDDFFHHTKAFAKEDISPEFSRELAEVTEDFRLIKIKVFAPSGEAIFSTDAKEIGVMNTHDYFHQVVAKGKSHTKIVKKDERSLDGQKVSRDVVETYVPVMEGDTFLGAFEIYQDITDSKAKLDILVQNSKELLLVISASLILAMLFISNRARANILARRQTEAIIHRQREDLAENNKDLLIVNEISEVISHSTDMEQLLPGILEIIASRFSTFSDIRQGGIFLVEDDKLVLTSHRGHDDEFLRLHQGLTINDCLCGQVARTGEVLFSESSAHDVRHTLCAKHGKAHGHVIIPLIAHDAVVGVLYLYTEENVQLANKHDLLKGLGRQIGLAINNVNLYQQTKRLALYDQLTGLPNRRFMEARLDDAVTTAARYERPFSVAMLDIDFFKKYNDTMGHAAGDRILAEVGALIRKETREADFAARYGGEEFIVILTETEQCGACIGVERIRRTVEQKAGVTVSIGVTSYRPGLDLAQMLKEADVALYQAKHNGRNRVEWSEASAKPCHEAPA